MRRQLPQSNLQAEMHDIRADYAAMKSSRFRRTRTGLGGGADAHYANESKFLEMREYARDMDRNDGIVPQMIDRAVTNCAQGGFALDPKTGDASLDADLWGGFTGWANDRLACDVTGERTFPMMERTVLRAAVVDGDVFGNPLDNGKLELIEAHRCRTPSNTNRRVVHGVMLGPSNEREEYWFTRNPVDPFTRVEKVADMLRIPARDQDGFRSLFQVYDPRRISQTRGVTWVAPVFDTLGMIEDVNFAKLVQQQMVSCFAAFLARDKDFQLGGRTEDTEDDSTTKTLEAISPGLIMRGRKGESLTAISSNVPNAEYFEHVKLLLTIVGLNVGLPLVMVLMDAKETNFSGWRGAVDQARLGFESIQRWLRVQWHEEVYRWRVRYMMSKDAALRNAAARSGINIFAHNWQPPRWRYIQPLQDAQADALRLNKLMSSPRRVLGEQGIDHEEIVAETTEDNKKAIVAAIKRAQEIKSETGETVSWREVLFLTDRDPTTTAPAATDEDEEQSQPGDKPNARNKQQPA
jgi:lambda family phage portal protein